MERSKKGADGKYEIPNEKTKLVAEKANDLRQKAIEGEWTSNRHDDVRALEKREHPSQGRGIGGMVGIKDVFGEGEKMKGPRGMISADQLYMITQDIEAKIRQEMEAKMREMEGKVSQMQSMMHSMVEQQAPNILNKMGMQTSIAMGVDNIPSAGHHNSCQSIPSINLHDANKTQQKELFVKLQKPTKCRLALKLDSKIVEVGSDMVHPASRLGDQCHNQQILADHVKVGIDAVDSSHEGTPLPVPIKHHNTIGEAVGSFVQWLKSLMLLRDNNNTGFMSQPNKGVIGSNNDRAVNTMENEATELNAIVDEGILKILTKECQYFHDLIVQGTSDASIISTIPMNKELFKYNKDFETKIRNDDIVQFLSMAWLNASWLQIYIMWLNHKFNDLELETIRFMCPHKLSQVRISPNVTNSYILNTRREYQSKSSLLASYYEEKHCLLFVFDLQKNKVYVFHPQVESKRNLEIKAQVHVAFKLYKAASLEEVRP